VWEAGWRDGHLGHVPEALVRQRTPESFSRRAAAMIDRTFVAEVDGDVAGFVTLKGDELEQLFVDADVRGSGVAKALLGEGARRLLEAGHEHPWLAVVAGNARARRFYEREGWRDTGPLAYEAPVDGGSSQSTGAVTNSCDRGGAP